MDPKRSRHLGPREARVTIAGVVHPSMGHDLSYRSCYHRRMSQRTKRSVSLPHDLAEEIARAATRSRTTFSGWLAETAAHRLRLEAGRRALAAWEREHGALTAEERAEGRARARAILGRGRARSARRSA